MADMGARRQGQEGQLPFPGMLKVDIFIRVTLIKCANHTDFNVKI